MQTQKSWPQHLLSSKAFHQSRLSFIILEPHQVKAEVTPEQLVLFDCIFMKPCTKLLSSFIMSSSGSHSYRFLTVDNSTVRAATNSYLQFSYTPKQAGLALQAAGCELWLESVVNRALLLASTEPRSLSEDTWIYSCSIFGFSNNEEKKKKRPVYEIQFTQDEMQLHWLSSLNMQFTSQ